MQKKTVLSKRGLVEYARVNPFRTESMPRFPGWRFVFGPALVWLALAQGSGELIWWPYLVAKYGLGFVFLLIPACLIQYPLNLEIARYTIMTGETLYQGFVRMSRFFAVFVWILMTASFLWFGSFASAGGTALAALTGFPESFSPGARTLFWGYATIAAYLTALLLSRIVYVLIERFMTAAAIVTFGGLLLAVTHPDVVKAVPDFVSGLVFPVQSRPFESSDAERLITAITFAGLGGFWITFYSYWLREKGAGMASRMGHIAGLRGKKETILDSGFIPDHSDASQKESLRWLGFARVDSAIGLAGNIVTTLLTCLLAFALLHPRGLLPEGNDLAVVQAAFFEASWGPAGRILFLVVAAAFLSDTWLATLDAVARIQTDLTYHIVPAARARPFRWWYFFYIALFTVVTLATMALAQPAELILTSAMIGFAGTVVICGALFVLNFRVLAPRLPPALRPGAGAAVMLAVPAVSYTVLALAYLYIRFGPGW